MEGSDAMHGGAVSWYVLFLVYVVSYMFRVVVSLFSVLPSGDSFVYDA